MSRPHPIKLHVYRVSVALLFLVLWGLAQSLAWLLGGQGPIQRIGSAAPQANEAAAPKPPAQASQAGSAARDAGQRRRQLVW